MDTLSFSKTEIINLHQSEKVNFITQLDGDILFKNTDVILILHKGEQYSLRRTRNGDVVFILHKGEQYSLRRTRNGKLILNK